MSVAVMENPSINKSQIANTGDIVSYINNLRRNISAFLKSDKSYKSMAYAYDTGSVIKLEFVDNQLGSDNFEKRVHTLQEALREAGLELVDKNNKRITNHFSGTNIFAGENLVYIIKDNTSDEWSPKRAEIDTKKIVFG